MVDEKDFLAFTEDDVVDYAEVYDLDEGFGKGPSILMPDGTVYDLSRAFETHFGFFEVVFQGLHDSILDEYPGDTDVEYEGYLSYDQEKIMYRAEAELGIITLNVGLTYKEPRAKVVILSKPTEAQYGALTDFLDYVQQKGKKSVLFFMGDKIDYVEYQFGEDQGTDEIIDKVRRYFATGKIVEAQSADGMAYDDVIKAIEGSGLFPITADADETGFILPDGRFLNTADNEYGMPWHMAVEDFLGDKGLANEKARERSSENDSGDGSPTIEAFGAIRVSDGEEYICLPPVRPTEQAFSALEGWLAKMHDEHSLQRVYACNYEGNQDAFYDIVPGEEKEIVGKLRRYYSSNRLIESPKTLNLTEYFEEEDGPCFVTNEAKELADYLKRKINEGHGSYRIVHFYDQDVYAVASSYSMVHYWLDYNTRKQMYVDGNEFGARLMAYPIGASDDDNVDYYDCENKVYEFGDCGIKVAVIGDFPEDFEKTTLCKALGPITRKYEFEKDDSDKYESMRLPHATDLGKPKESHDKQNELTEAKDDELKFKDWLDSAYEAVGYQWSDPMLDISYEMRSADSCFDEFQDYRRRNKGRQTDYYYWMGQEPSMFFSFLARSIRKKSSKANVKKEAEAGAESVYDGKFWRVYKINTYEASCHYGKGTTWCISEYDDDYWDEYAEKGITFYFLLPKDGKKYMKYAIGIDRNGHVQMIFDQEDCNVEGVPNVPDIPELREVRDAMGLDFHVYFNMDEEFSTYDNFRDAWYAGVNWPEMLWFLSEDEEEIKRIMHDDLRMDDVEVVESLTEAKADVDKFKAWLADGIRGSNFSEPNADEVAKGYADFFVANKNRLKSPQNDFYYWMKKPFGEFVSFISDLKRKDDEKSLSKSKEDEGSKLVYEDEDWFVYEITNYEASKKYGANTKWCISGSKRWNNGENGRKFFDEYASKGIRFFFFIDRKGGRKYAFTAYPEALGDDAYEIYNDMDVRVPFIPNAPAVDELLAMYGKDNAFYGSVQDVRLELKLALAEGNYSPSTLKWIVDDYQLNYGGEEEFLIATDKYQLVNELDWLIPDEYLEWERSYEEAEASHKDDGDDSNSYSAYWDGDFCQISNWDEIPGWRNGKEYVTDPAHWKDGMYLLSPTGYDGLELTIEPTDVKDAVMVISSYYGPDFLADVSLDLMDAVRSGEYDAKKVAEDLGMSKEATDALIKYSKEKHEGLELTEAKADQDAFVDKFGQDLFDLFQKSKDRLKNAKVSTDMTWHVKNTDPKDMRQMLYNLRSKSVKTDGEGKADLTKIPGKYKYLGSKGGYDVYEPLDVDASMALGVGSGWCTTGRYGHAGDLNFKPSREDAEEHWDEYEEKGISLFYFLRDGVAKYAIALHPITYEINQWIGKDYLRKTNVEVFNQNDEQDYDALKYLPLDILDDDIVFDVDEHEDGLALSEDGRTVLQANENVVSVTIPEGVTSIDDYAFSHCSYLTSVVIPSSVASIGESAFLGCSSLASIVIPSSVTSIGEEAFADCSSLILITIPSSVTSIGDYAFEGCLSLKSVTIGNRSCEIGESAFPQKTKIIYAETESLKESHETVCYVLPDGSTMHGTDHFLMDLEIGDVDDEMQSETAKSFVRVRLNSYINSLTFPSHGITDAQEAKVRELLNGADLEGKTIEANTYDGKWYPRMKATDEVADQVLNSYKRHLLGISESSRSVDTANQGGIIVLREGNHMQHTKRELRKMIDCLNEAELNERIDELKAKVLRMVESDNSDYSDDAFMLNYARMVRARDYRPETLKDGSWMYGE